MMKKLETLLLLGRCDTGRKPKDIAGFLRPYHQDIILGKEKGTKVPEKEAFWKRKLKDEMYGDGKGAWLDFEEIAGTSIQELQQFLQKAGFFPQGKIDGIYGYRTRAAVRLFQEYVRTIDNEMGIGYPDGKVGNTTFKYIQAWQQRPPENFICEWGKEQGVANTEDYDHWIQLLQKGKQHFLNHDNKELQLTEARVKGSDTVAIENWNTDPDAIHLIGIRRNQKHWFDVNDKNEDLFVLLIKGMTFYFWGSTVSKPKEIKNKKIPSAAPFLPEGQHQYRFGWHGVQKTKKVQQALRPKSKGVLVFRCKNWKKGYIEEHEMKLDPKPNVSINIHWTGKGGKNWSEGCQVIAGGSYINHLGKVVDCSPFTASGNPDLGSKPGKIRKTYGAYDVLADLISSYGPIGDTTVHYTLVRDTFAFLSKKITKDSLEEKITKDSLEKTVTKLRAAAGFTKPKNQHFF